MVRDRLAPEMRLEDFILQTVEDHDLRRERIAALSAGAV